MKHSEALKCKLGTFQLEPSTVGATGPVDEVASKLTKHFEFGARQKHLAQRVKRQAKPDALARAYVMSLLKAKKITTKKRPV